MAITARLLADSTASCGARLTTYEAVYPRCIHAEILTHKMLSRCSASSRAITVDKMLARIVDDPFVPVYIGANQKGMQPGEELSDASRTAAVDTWLMARDSAVGFARVLQNLNVHKGVVNRVTEPFMWITVIISMTEDENFFGLRDHEAAEPHFQELARKMRAARDASLPKVLQDGEWHLPLWADNAGHADDEVNLEDFVEKIFGDAGPTRPSEVDYLKKKLRVQISVGRCARVSYLTHDGRRDLAEDVSLHDRLVVSRPLHASPAEHVAQAMGFPVWYDNMAGTKSATSVKNLMARVHESRQRRAAGVDPTLQDLRDEAALGEMRSGNFFGFRQYRKTLANEHIGGPMP